MNIDVEKWTALGFFYGMIFILGLGYYKIIPLLFAGNSGITFNYDKMMPFGNFCLYSALMYGSGLIICFIIEKIREGLKIK